MSSEAVKQAGTCGVGVPVEPTADITRHQAVDTLRFIVAGIRTSRLAVAGDDKDAGLADVANRLTDDAAGAATNLVRLLHSTWAELRSDQVEGIVDAAAALGVVRDRWQ